MKKQTTLLQIILGICLMTLQLAVFAQAPVEHEVKPGETLSGIAKKYQVTVGDVMRFNGMNSKSILKLGQKIKIPSKGEKVVVKGESPILKDEKAPTKAIKESAKKIEPIVKKEANPTSNPTELTTEPKEATKHIVTEGESLYKLSKQYHVSVEQIRTWNKLSDYSIKIGQELILSDGIITNSPSKINTEIKSPKTIITKTEDVAPKSNVEVKKEITKEAEEIVVEKAPVKVKEIAKPVTPPIDDKNTAKEEVIISDKKQVATEKVTSEVTNNNFKVSYKGFFEPQFVSSQHEISGDAATFKTSSGWMDKKYYVLINNIEAGRIVRIGANGNEIYAKVLGVLPDVKEDAGLLLRISNAAASALGITDIKFKVTVQY